MRVASAQPRQMPAQLTIRRRQREAREDWVLMRVATVVLVLAAAAVTMIFVLMTAGYQ
jgi:hypothetical protein